MLETRTSESSEIDVFSRDVSNNDNLNSLITIEKDGSKVKFKWQGSIEELKRFVTSSLSFLDGTWSRVSNNGGFHVLKSRAATLSFYPNTKTLNIHGASKDTVKKKIESLASIPTNLLNQSENHQTNMNQDGRTLEDLEQSILSDKWDEEPEEANSNIHLPEMCCGCNHISKNFLKHTQQLLVLQTCFGSVFCLHQCFNE